MFVYLITTLQASGMEMITEEQLSQVKEEIKASIRKYFKIRN